MQAYCVKCRATTEVKEPHPVTLGNGRPAIQGVCPKCGTKVSRIVKATGKVKEWQDKQDKASKKSKTKTGASPKPKE